MDDDSSSPAPGAPNDRDRTRRVCEKLIQEHMQEIVSQGAVKSVEQGSLYSNGSVTLEASDISGDMNHVYRVCVVPCDVRTTPTSTEAAATVGEEESTSKEEGFSVIVKISPSDVPYLREDECITVDPNKIEHEYSVLCKFHQLQENSVPRTYMLDRHRKAIIMEDMVSFRNLTEVVTSTDEGLVTTVRGAVEACLRFIGHVHTATWLENMTWEEKGQARVHFSNPSMRRLMSELLFDKPFDPADKTNHCNPLLLPTVEAMRSDTQVVEKVTALKTAFLSQDDCLCHGDLATDNVLVQSEEFRLIDCEFSGVGLRAYDLALFLQMLLYQLLRHHHHKSFRRALQVYELVEAALKGYGQGVGLTQMMDDPTFVDQVCGLIACEFFWTRCSIGGDIEAEEHMLSLSRLFLLHSNDQHSIAWNIRQHLDKELGFSAYQTKFK